MTKRKLVANKDVQIEQDPPEEIVQPDEQDLGAELDLEPGPDLVNGNEPTGPARAQACHEMLLRMAGRAPDGLMTQARDWLAHGQFDLLVRAVAYWVVSQDVMLAEPDADLLSDMLIEAGADTSGISQVADDDYDPYPFYGFGSHIPRGLAGDTGETPDPLAEAEAPQEKAAVEAVAAEPDAIGLWRAWRFPTDKAPWPAPRRVFVVEVADGGQPGVAARMAERLAAAGETDPQVEVYRSGFQPPIYTELARSYGELRWAAAPASSIQLASIFDEVDADTGPRFLPDHPVLDADEAVKVMEYLYGCEPLLETLGLMDDVMDDSQPYCVPMSFRTDGQWVWNEASAYYANEHLLAPDPRLLEHVRSSDYLAPAVDGVSLFRALKSLQDSKADEVSWMFGAQFEESMEQEF